MVLYVYMCVCTFSLYRESPDRILGDKPLLFQGGFCHMHDWNRKVRLESGYTTRVISSDRSRAYFQSHVLRPESGIRSESCLPIGVGHMIGVTSFKRSREIPTLQACIMGNIRHENLFVAPNRIKELVNFLLRAIRSIIHSAGSDHSP
jgi:hypothetical protein